LGKEEDSVRYSELAESIRDVFRSSFLDKETGIVSGNCQTSMACALYYHLANDKERSKVLDKLVEQVELKNYHIDCGILGAKYVMHALTESGKADLAFAIVTQTTFPGWGHWIAQGATTLWETWNGDSSRNHHMFSDISAWFYKGLAGINPDPDEPGFKHIILRPHHVDGLQWVKCSHRSMYGDIICNWEADREEFKIKVVIPVNSHATLYIPAGYSRDIVGYDKSLDESIGEGILHDGHSQAVLYLDSGSYEIIAVK